jgi:hypothetical protein
MKKNLFFILTIVLATALILSCDNQNSNKKNDEADVNEKKEIVIEYLEDFAQFENHDQVAEHFGEENVLATEWFVAEGESRYSVSILNYNHKHKIIVYWDQDTEDYKDFFQVEAVYMGYHPVNWEAVSEEGETYKSKSGLYVGQSLNELEELNGAPFMFWGLGWDYGGYAYNLSEKLFGYVIRIDISEEYFEIENGFDNYVNVTGEIEINSNDPFVKEMPLKIVSLSYSLQEGC